MVPMLRVEHTATKEFWGKKKKKVCSKLIDCYIVIQDVQNNVNSLL